MKYEICSHTQTYLARMLNRQTFLCGRVRRGRIGGGKNRLLQTGDEVRIGKKAEREKEQKEQ